MIGTILVSVVMSYVGVSLFEYHIHKYLMHRRSLPRIAYRKIPYFQSVFQSHAIRHHHLWYRRFDYEPDPVGRHENVGSGIKGTLLFISLGIPLWTSLTLLSPIFAVTFVLMTVLHNRVWNAFHRQMHIPENRFFKDWAVYRALARYHFLHHRFPHRNFNLVFPLVDHLLDTVAQPMLGDVREMLMLGLLNPRSSGSRDRVARQRALAGSL